MQNVNWVMLTVIAIMIISIILGLKKGIIKMVYAVISIALSLVLTIIISPIVKNKFIANDKIYDFFYQKTESVLAETPLHDKLEELTLNIEDESTAGLDSIELLDNVLTLIGIPEGARNSLLGDDSFIAKLELDSDAEASEKTKTIENNIYSGITGIIISALSFLVTLLIVGIIVFVIGKLLGLLGELPVIEGVNAFAGAAAGAFIGLVIVWIFFAIITMLGTSSFGQSGLSCINDNALLSFIYKHNVISARILS